MDGRAVLRVRSIVGLLLHIAKIWLCDPTWLRMDLRFAYVILGLSEVCTAKS